VGGAWLRRRALRLLTRTTPGGQVPYFWAGLKAYDAVAGTSALAWSHYLGADASREVFPTLLAERPDGSTLKGSVSDSSVCGRQLVLSHAASSAQIVYYDGQMNDARVNVALATTAAMSGAVVANHVSVISLTKARALPSWNCFSRTMTRGRAAGCR
jgi:glycerol-3-phosphate dehydrogenase